MEADLALYEGASEVTARLGAEAARLGNELGVPDVEAIGLAYEGHGLVASGRTEEGMRRLDEASAAASSEDFEMAMSPGWALCCVIGACTAAGDFDRAAQWCATLENFTDDWGGRHMAGICRSDYGCVLATGGDWKGAEAQLVAAVEDLTASRPALAVAGLMRLADLRARQGRAEEARALYEESGAAGALGLAQLALTAGDAAGACDGAARVLRHIADSALLYRVPALELLVQARAALGELDAAAGDYAELRAAADTIGTPYIIGHADLAGAELALASGDHDGARRLAEDALDRLQRGAAPHDAALARVALAQGAARARPRPRRRGGAARRARDLRPARRGRRQRARARRCSTRTAREDRTASLGDLTAREIDVLRLVAQGYSDGEIAAELIVSPHTVHRHVANVRTKLGLSSRAAAVAYAARSGML